MSSRPQMSVRGRPVSRGVVVLKAKTPHTRQPSQGIGPPAPPANNLVGLQCALYDNNRVVLHGNEASQLGVRAPVAHWQDLGADNVLLHAITHGDRSPLHPVPQASEVAMRSIQASITREFEQRLLEGAVKRLTDANASKKRYWVPPSGPPRRDGRSRLNADLKPE